MAKSVPRIYLFHGNDSHASAQAVRRWEERFVTKFGDSTKYVLHADEFSSEDLSRRLGEILMGGTLFSEPKFVLVKRITSHDKGAATSFSKATVAVLKESLKAIDDMVTVVIWEEKEVGAKHPLLVWFRELSDKNTASITVHSVPGFRDMVPKARAYVADSGKQLDAQAERWLIDEYQRLEKESRLRKRLRATDILTEDERSWWLYNLLDTAILHAVGVVIKDADLMASHQVLGQSVGVFEVVNAIAGGHYIRAREMLRTWERARVEDSAYFGLYALLRMQFRKDRNYYALQLLAQIELLVKNFSLTHSWLLDMLLVRLAEGGNKDLLTPKKLWLAQLHRS